jgi:hypothetical protein
MCKNREQGILSAAQRRISPCQGENVRISPPVRGRTPPLGRRREGPLLLLCLALLLASPAHAVCTQHGTVASTSTAIVGSNDVAGIEGRHYFLIQNTGTTNPMNVAIGSSNAATSTDLYLGPGASWVMTMQELKMVPGGDVAAISVSGTTYSFCDW